MSHQHRAYSLTALFLFMTVVVVVLAIARSAMVAAGTSSITFGYLIVGFVAGVIVELFACGGYPPHAGARALGFAAGGATGAALTVLIMLGASLWSFVAGAVGLTLFGLVLRYLRRPETTG